MKCSSDENGCQPFPRTGRLAGNMNLEFEVLRDRLTADGAVTYCYVVATVKNREARFVQIGSAPNFQGDLITLCTCKHRMRTYMGTDAWVGKWIAGFTGVEAGRGRNALVYLMQVEHALRSHRDLWEADSIPAGTKDAKAAHSHICGDVYQPRSKSGAAFDPEDYVSPHRNHVHASNDCWHKDIHYKGCSGRMAALLIGDPHNSFLWDHPLILYRGRLGRAQQKHTLGDLMGRLETEGRL